MLAVGDGCFFFFFSLLFCFVLFNSELSSQMNMMNMPEHIEGSTVHNYVKRRKRNEAAWFEPQHDKTNKMTCAPSEDSGQPGYPPSLNRVFAVR